MSKFLKIVSIVVVAVLVALVIGTQAVRALRAIAAPEPLPYGLTMQDTRAIGGTEVGSTQDSSEIL